MWMRIFDRFGKRFGKLTPVGVLLLIAVLGLLILGIYRLLG